MQLWTELVAQVYMNWNCMYITPLKNSLFFVADALQAIVCVHSIQLIDLSFFFLHVVFLLLLTSINSIRTKISCPPKIHCILVRKEYIYGDKFAWVVISVCCEPVMHAQPMVRAGSPLWWGTDEQFSYALCRGKKIPTDFWAFEMEDCPTLYTHTHTLWRSQLPKIISYGTL